MPVTGLWVEPVGREAMDPVERKRARLRTILREMASALVAFSGGVDSSLLLRVAEEELGEKVEAVTVRSPLHPAWEVEEAAEIASNIGIPHRILSHGGWTHRSFRANRRDRCYRCKRSLMSDLLAHARSRGLEWVLEGSHAGDREEDRPGMRALREMGIRSPLREAALDKGEIRQWSRELGLANWDRPARACLATRIPTGTPITLARLRRVERAEGLLRGLGFRQFRARLHGKAIRLEVGADEVGRLLEDNARLDLLERFRSVGFPDVWIDLRGYRSAD
jgi:pyridinium-3,5-biscarboxylic acid mononucleotide sulfurtransferase